MRVIYDEFKDFIYNDKNFEGFHRYNQEDIPNFTQRVNRSLEIVNPTAIFIFNNKPLVLFFDKRNKNREEIFKNCWNFAESPIIIIENDFDYEIYNGFEFILENKKFSLTPINDKNLSSLSLISGEYFRKNNFKNFDKHLNTVLLNNIKYARKAIINSLAKNVINSNYKINEYIINDIANALIGRIIFIRYLIDRKVALFYNNKKQIISNDDLKDILSDKIKTYSFFKDLQSWEKGFNGDWFPIEEYEEQIVNKEQLQILKELISGSDIKSNQRSLFDIYDFSIIPIEFISNVYEYFIGEEKQRKDGAYYTPTFLVDYILKFTIDEYFKNNPYEYNCKVLDPACGSGIFLVETFRKLVKQYEKVTGKKADEQTIKNIVKNNIFGIDFNKSALQIAVFSLYLAMLDYQEPKDIENFKFPYLTRENPNFFENDFFDTEAVFNKALKDKKIDFIIGNPPYGRGGGKDSNVIRYIKEKEKNDNIKIGYSNKEISQAFIVRASDISRNAEIAFVINSKNFYNYNAKQFRRYLLEQYSIKHILELSSVRKEIFNRIKGSKAPIPPIALIFYKHGNNDKNQIKYISIKPHRLFSSLKILPISKQDFKKVHQKKLIDNDYLWKILVYGNYLDYNFIKRLKNYKNIRDFINENKCLYGMGINKGTYKNKNVEHYIGKNFIDASKKQIEAFYISNKLSVWKEEKVQIPSKEELFKKYSVVTPQGLELDTLKTKSAIIYEEALFADTISAINVNNLDKARNLLGILNSSLIGYLNLLVSSSAGIEREKILHNEKLSIPYIDNDKIINIVKKIEQLKQKYYTDSILNYEYELVQLIKKLDCIVLKSFNLDEQEYSLVDFATNILIPWIIKKRYDVAFSKYKYKDKRIEDYIKVFTEHYIKFYKERGFYFQASVYWDQYVIGIYFKTLNKKPKNTVKWIKEKSIQNFPNITKDKIINNLFIQKDIKGFERDGFYVVKPNEIKNWHKAIAYLDFYEFKDAILKAGKYKWKN